MNSLRKIHYWQHVHTNWIAAWAFMSLFALLKPAALNAQQPTGKPNEWLEDLDTLAGNLPKLHKNFFFQLSPSKFYSEVAQLRLAIPGLSDEQIIIKMAKIAAMAGDAHTSLSLQQKAIPFRTLPLRLQWFSDGLFVTEALPAYRSFLGLRLVKIGGTDVEEVYREVGSLISHENEAWLRYKSQTYLAIPEVLHALGFLADTENVSCTLQRGDGEFLDLDMQPVPRTLATNWVSYFDYSDGIDRPLYLKNRQSGFLYWVDYLTDSSTLYLKYDLCSSDAAIPFQKVADEVMQFIGMGIARRVVIDVRNNTGGDSSVFAPMIEGLRLSIATGRLAARDLSVIIGSQTFSSGMLNAIQLKNIGARLVGEPSGGKPNSYGEVRYLVLPKSGITVGYSTKYFTLSNVQTPSLMPDTQAVMSSTDFFSGRDPALEAITNGESAKTSVSGFLLPLGGGLSQSTGIAGRTVSTGYATLESGTADPAPAGLAILTARRNGVTVSETTVPAAVASSAGRIYVEMHGAVKTGIAFANPSDAPVKISFYFTDPSGTNLKEGATIVAAKAQFAGYLDQAPFNGDSTFEGTFTWTSDTPIGAVAVREFLTRERELMTTLPIPALAASANKILVLPQFADGGGWKTQVVLVNPTDDILTGSLRFIGQGNGSETAAPVEVEIDGVKASSFPYELPPRAGRRFLTGGAQVEAQSGSIQIIPGDATTVPSAMAIFTFGSGEELISTAGVIALAPASRFRIYAEAFGGFEIADLGSSMTGLAICNVSDAPATAKLTLRYLNGRVAGTSSLSLAPQGQIALFLNQIPGFQALPKPFKGSLAIEADSASVAVTGIRAKFNEQREFLISATPAIDENDGSGRRLFAHLADGDGYSSQVVLMSTASAVNAAGWVQFFTPAGIPWSLLLR